MPRKYPHSKLQEGLSDAGGDGRPVIGEEDPLLAALKREHADKIPRDDDEPAA